MLLKKLIKGQGIVADTLLPSPFPARPAEELPSDLSIFLHTNSHIHHTHGIDRIVTSESIGSKPVYRSDRNQCIDRTATSVSIGSQPVYRSDCNECIDRIETSVSIGSKPCIRERPMQEAHCFLPAIFPSFSSIPGNKPASFREQHEWFPEVG